MQFLANMNSAAYLGQTHWQAPTIDASCPGFNCGGTLNPMGNLFYTQLGLSQGMAAVATPNVAVGPFHYLQPYLYWSCVGATIQSACESAGPADNFEESYSFGSGFQGTDLLANNLYVTAYFVGAPANLCTYSLSSGGQAFTAAGGTGFDRDHDQRELPVDGGPTTQLGDVDESVVGDGQWNGDVRGVSEYGCGSLEHAQHWRRGVHRRAAVGYGPRAGLSSGRCRISRRRRTGRRLSRWSTKARRRRRRA